MTRNAAFNLLKSIFDKKIPCKMGKTELASWRINHIIRNNVPQDEIGNLMFDWEYDEEIDDINYECFYNKTYGIWINVIVRYVMVIGDPSKSHWKITGYKII